MARELPRTAFSLGHRYQRGTGMGKVELIVVDNGSAVPVDEGALEQAFGAQVRLERIDPAPPSPAHAANVGIELATGDMIGLIIDGARLASPGLVDGARRAGRLADRAVVTAPAWHLGPVVHMKAAEAGYGQVAEDELLDRSGWEDDGYALFSHSTPAASSARGLFGPMGESSSLFLTRALWDELGGLDEGFELPGGGLVNHDLYRRACELPGAELVVLLGEGTFHQYHGGAATSRRLTWDDMHAEYRRVRGIDHVPPPNQPLFVGRVPKAFLAHVARSAEQAR
jgi:glycosyltransferase involved in cell wall biosynthesis